VCRNDHDLCKIADASFQFTFFGQMRFDMGMHLAESYFVNRILRTLQPEEIRALKPNLTRVRLLRGQVIYEPGEDIAQIYFIEEGMISLGAPSDNAHQHVAIAIVGRDSVLGATAVLSTKAISFHRTTVQMPGFAYRLSATAARNFLGRLPVFKGLLFQALDISLAQISQEVACQRSHTLSERLARWLLSANHLLASDTLQVTQDILAKMLAVRRPGVSVALGSFEASGLIQQSRGRVIVCDRDGLAAAACPCDGHFRAYVASVSGLAGAVGAYAAQAAHHAPQATLLAHSEDAKPLKPETVKTETVKPAMLYQ